MGMRNEVNPCFDRKGQENFCLQSVREVFWISDDAASLKSGLASLLSSAAFFDILDHI
jgi:hypothetical protein